MISTQHSKDVNQAQVRGLVKPYIERTFGKNWNDFINSETEKNYFKTKTQKSGKNLEILQRQRDSVKRVLDKSILELANKVKDVYYRRYNKQLSIYLPEEVNNSKVKEKAYALIVDKR